ncbi:hypothetical protein IBX73_09520 [candidate division WOR-3 bacterium]|nr:hypothetical protein [candidate division WOR-3 bacterium]
MKIRREIVDVSILRFLHNNAANLASFSTCFSKKFRAISDRLKIISVYCLLLVVYGTEKEEHPNMASRDLFGSESRFLGILIDRRMIRMFAIGAPRKSITRGV